MTLSEKLTTTIREEATKLWPDIKMPPFDVVASHTPPAGGPEFGDLSTPIALTLGKIAGANPMTMAEALKQALTHLRLEHVKQMTVTNPGYVNFWIDFEPLANHLLDKILKQGPAFGQNQHDMGNVVIEHTSVNPNKAAHVGHLRNAALGDSLARLLRTVGYQVEVQNYIDDLGVQVADSVVAYEQFGDDKKDPGPNLNAAPSKTGLTGDDKWFWRAYARINTLYETQPQLLERRVVVLHEMEAGKNNLAKEIVKRMVKAQLATFKQFSIGYDLLIYETDIIKHHLWDNLFEKLKDKKLIHLAKSGDHKGAWVVEFGKEEREDKILVRSNGLPTYTAKDLAYALWKFNKLPGMPKYKRKFAQVDKHVNLVDTRQSYPQAVVKYVMEQLGFEREANSYIHLAYGVVKLSESAMKQLGQHTGDKKTYSMSGRAGIGAKVDDVYELAKIKQEQERGSGQRVAEAIAAGSIRYYMLKNRPNKDVIFDFDEALRTDGNTGVYIQYAYARCNNILAKVPDYSPQSEPVATPQDISPEAKTLIKTLERYPALLREAAEATDPSLLTEYAFNLANELAKFYENNPVLKSDTAVKHFRLQLIASVKQVLGNLMGIIGMTPLEKI